MLPNGYTEGPRKFTKVMKPPLAILRKEYSILLADYIEDIIIMNTSKERCPDDIDKIINLLNGLGFGKENDYLLDR